MGFLVSCFLRALGHCQGRGVADLVHGRHAYKEILGGRAETVSHAAFVGRPVAHAAAMAKRQLERRMPFDDSHNTI